MLGAVQPYGCHTLFNIARLMMFETCYWFALGLLVVRHGATRVGAVLMGAL